MSDPDRFDPGSVGTFRVTDRSFDTAIQDASLSATPSTMTGRSWRPSPSRHRRPMRSVAVAPGLARALLHLHVAAGTSYYKAAAPPVVIVEDETLSPAELAIPPAISTTRASASSRSPTASPCPGRW